MHPFIEGHVGGSVTVRVILPRASLEFFAQMDTHSRRPKYCIYRLFIRNIIIRNFCSFIMRCSELRWMTNATQYPGPEYWVEEHDLFIGAWTLLLGLWAACEILHPAIWTLRQVNNNFGDLGTHWGFAFMDIHLLSGDFNGRRGPVKRIKNREEMEENSPSCT